METTGVISCLIGVRSMLMKDPLTQVGIRVSGFGFRLWGFPGFGGFYAQGLGIAWGF